MKLVEKILDFVERYEPYSLTEESIQETMEALEDDAVGIINWLETFLDEDVEISNAAAELIADIAERRTA